MFDKACKRVNTFENFRTELVEGKEKRAGTELVQEITKKQKVENDKETAELKQLMKIIPDEEEVAIDAIPLAVNQMLKSFDKEDLEDLYKLVKARYGSTRPVESMDYLLWNDMKTMFEPHVEDAIWMNQQGYKVLEWKLYNSCEVHSLMMQSMQIYMLVEKKYPLTPPTLLMMLEKKLQIDYETGVSTAQRLQRKYAKIWYDDDVHDLRSIETEFPAIVFNDTLTPKVALSCEPTLSSLYNNEIDFRISFDEYDDEDYTVIFEKNSLSYKIISVGDLKTDLENDNDKVNMPSFPSPEPTVSYFDDLDYLKDFEKEFSAIVYNDALTSKSDFLTELTVSPQRIDEFNLKNETSLSEYDEEEQNVLYFNDLFPFNIIYPDDSKSNKDNDNKLWDVFVIPLPDEINTDVDMALPPRDQRYQYLRFEGLEYTDSGITYFEERLGKIYGRGIHQVLVLDFECLPAEMAEGLTSRMLMKHRDTQGAELIACSIAWRSRAPEKVTVIEGAPDIAEGAQAVPAPIQTPQPPLASVPARITGLSRMMDHAGVRYTSYLDFQIPYVRRTRHRTDDASTLAP
ncbi:hypothetical protein Tco_0133063 [Tanacetum coccineum]